MEKIKVRLISLVIVMLILFGGCNKMSQSFNSKESAQEYALNKMEEKYGAVFKYKEGSKENYDEYPLKDIYTATLYSQDLDGEARIWASSLNELKDNLALTYFSSELIEPVKNIVNENERFSNTTIEISNQLTEKLFTPEDSADDYFEATKASFLIDTTNNVAQTDEELAVSIEQLLNELYQFDRFTLKVYREETLKFFYQYSGAKKQLSAVEIEEKILEQEQDNRFNDEAWKIIQEEKKKE